MDRSQLRQMIITYFSLEDFKDLCFELGTYGVSYDALAGDGLPPKARELILLCERAGIQPALIAACRRLRGATSLPVRATPPCAIGCARGVARALQR